jgi:hypothetical protein
MEKEPFEKPNKAKNSEHYRGKDSFEPTQPDSIETLNPKLEEEDSADEQEVI